MFEIIAGVKTYYEVKGNHPKVMVLLHGWGQNTQMMDFIAEGMKEHFTVYNIDFPGFGQSEQPPEAWDCDNYTEHLRAFCLNHGIENPIFVAHSFGCRIALRYAYRYGALKMCLTGAAGLLDDRGLDYYFRIYSYKAAKALLSIGPLKKYRDRLMKNAGSEDYRNSSGVMRATFVKVVNSDVKDILPEINTETLLVFGENDTATPLKKGKQMEKMMPNAALVVFEGDDHYAYFHQALRFIRVLEAFLRSEYVD